MKQVSLSQPTHGYAQNEKVWVFSNHGNYVLIEDIYKKNRRIIPQSSIQNIKK